MWGLARLGRGGKERRTYRSSSERFSVILVRLELFSGWKQQLIVERKRERREEDKVGFSLERSPAQTASVESIEYSAISSDHSQALSASSTSERTTFDFPRPPHQLEAITRFRERGNSSGASE